MSNPWLDDEGDFAKKPQRKEPNRWLDDDDEEFDPNRDYMTQVVQRKQNDMLASTQRSLRMLNESEEVGTATAEELLRQREVLERTEKKVDKIDQDLNQSEYHIRSIKSLWGAFTNKFRKAPEPSQVPEPKIESSNSSSTLKEAMMQSQQQQQQDAGWGGDEDSHPVLRRQDESHNMYSQQQKQRTKSSVDQQVDDNLDQMSSALSRLKGLGLGLQGEIDSSSEIITRLGPKVDMVDQRTRRTNRELDKLNRS